MILNDRSIAECLNRKIIDVSPDVTDEQVQPASLDVRLGSKLYDVQNDSVEDADEVHVVEPGRAYIGHTMDHVTLPVDIAAMLTGRSSVGRKGVIIHKTAGWIDPGFSGELTLEIFNHSHEEVELEVGSRVGQLVFFLLNEPSEGYDGQYQDQEGITT